MSSLLKQREEDFEYISTSGVAVRVVCISEKHGFTDASFGRFPRREPLLERRLDGTERTWSEGRAEGGWGEECGKRSRDVVHSLCKNSEMT